MNKSVLVLDCGATNVKACLVDEKGCVIATHSLPNETKPDPEYEGGLVWDIQDIWNKLVQCTLALGKSAGELNIAAITVTSFGVDGAPMKKDGSFCYPVISWKCSRTEAVMKKLNSVLEPDWLYQTTGLQSYHFNTINKLIWLKENRPDVLESMDYYVMVPSIIGYFLTGEFYTDSTMAGTTMLTDLKNRSFSAAVLNEIGLNPSVFPKTLEPGTTAGQLQKEAADAMNLPEGIPVTVSGHDTQFSVIGSGAQAHEPVLSSGTWEILMVRTDIGSLKIPRLQSGITIELDAVKGMVNPGLQWVASGMIEWISKLLYADYDENDQRYLAMVAEAGKIPAGSNGVQVIPEIYAGGFSGKRGTISGFTHETKRGAILRATLESLSFYTRHALAALQQTAGFRAENVICTGGGSKNRLWNQIRADILGLRIKVPDVKEATALGAVMVTLTGLGHFKSLGEAALSMQSKTTEFFPGTDSDKYASLYAEYVIGVFGQRQ